MWDLLNYYSQKAPTITEIETKLQTECQAFVSERDLKCQLKQVSTHNFAIEILFYSILIKLFKIFTFQIYKSIIMKILKLDSLIDKSSNKILA